MKKTLLIIVIAVAAGVGYFLETKKVQVTTQQRASVEAALALESERYPATPVWWADGDILAVGMRAVDEAVITAGAKDICKILWKFDVNRTAVEVYDIEKIQQNDDWKLIGGADCRR
ncbi:hypothetical protein [Aliamphritea hakodatensis]|uniref:hypothetical protein n=1 Tax=Aliamphritea hakodatensis TaxID=2895352 RepID=UPI0022FDB057|nr:hypothetical protein [Aliamphritea hakodatensis]